MRAFPKPPSRSIKRSGFVVRRNLEMNEMNKQSSPETAALPRIASRTRSRLCKALVLTVMMFGGIGDEAQAFSKTGGPEQSSEPKKTTTKQVKSYVCPMHPEVKSTKRGKCPKCKMDLRLERAATSSTDNKNLLAGNTVAKATATSANSTDAAAGNAAGSARKMVIPEVEVLDQNGNSL